MSGKINLVWPLTVYPLAGYSDHGLVDLAVWQPAAGPAYVRALQERATPAIDATYLLEAGTQDTAEVMAIIEWVRRGRDVWIADPVARAYEDLYLGAGDGVTATFTVPVLAAGYSGLTVYVDGIPTTPTIAEPANLYDDDEALADWTGGKLAMNANAVGSSSPAYAYLPGQGATTLVDATAASARLYARDHFASGSGSPTVPAGIGTQPFAGAALLKPTQAGDLILGMYWYDASPALVGGAETTITSPTVGEWIQLTAAGAGSATAVRIKMNAGRTASATADFAAALFALGYGDRIDWWLPSRAPLTVVLPSVPAAGAAVTARVTGQRLYQVVAAREPDVRVDAAGNRTVRISWQGVRP